MPEATRTRAISSAFCGAWLAQTSSINAGIRSGDGMPRWSRSLNEGDAFNAMTNGRVSLPSAKSLPRRFPVRRLSPM